jgi:hypothetical protein
MAYSPRRVRLAGTILLVIVSCCISAVSSAQSKLEDALGQFDSETVKGYIQPMADFFGANMNAGHYHSASIPVTGLKIEFDVIGMGSLVGDDQKTFEAAAPPGFGVTTFETATIYGGKGATIYGPDSLSYSGSDGIIDASLFPLAVPQLTVGSVYGTEATIRYIGTPSIGDDEFPSTTLFGIGARHSISQYLPAVPLDISAGFFYSSFSVGDLIDFTGLSIGAQASKSFAVAHVYGGLAWEKSTMNISYTSSAPGAGNVDLDLDGDNSFRFTLGAGLSLGVLKVFADANFGSITNFSGGIGLGF